MKTPNQSQKTTLETECFRVWAGPQARASDQTAKGSQSPYEPSRDPKDLDSDLADRDKNKPQDYLKKKRKKKEKMANIFFVVIGKSSFSSLKDG